MKKIIHKMMPEEKHFTAGDGCLVSEILHPEREELPYSCYSLAHAFLEPGARTQKHYLKGSAETYICLAGTALLYINGEEIKLEKGVCALVPADAEQYVVNKGKERLEFLCIVTPPWSAGNEIVF